MFRFIGKRVLSSMFPVLVNKKLIFLPHLFMTYCFIGLLSTLVYEVFGRDTLLMLFGWYYIGGWDEVLLCISICTYALRVLLFRRIIV